MDNNDPTDLGLPMPPAALPQRQRVQRRISSPIWSRGESQMVGTALAKLWNITTTRRTGESDFKPIFAAFLENLSIFPPDAVATACAVWPDLSRGEWWPSLKELQAVVREYLPPQKDEYQAAPERAAPSPDERARVEAGFVEVIDDTRPSSVKLADRKRPPPRYLTGHHLVESRKRAIERLAEYGAQGGE